MALADHLPREAAEALLELATGGKPRYAPAVAAAADPFAHPDAQRRFRVDENVEELQRALGIPVGEVDRLPPPRAAEWVERDYRAPASGRPARARHRRPASRRLPRPRRIRIAAYC